MKRLTSALGFFIIIGVLFGRGVVPGLAQSPTPTRTPYVVPTVPTQYVGPPLAQPTATPYWGCPSQSVVTPGVPFDPLWYANCSQCVKGTPTINPAQATVDALLTQVVGTQQAIPTIGLCVGDACPTATPTATATVTPVPTQRPVEIYKVDIKEPGFSRKVDYGVWSDVNTSGVTNDFCPFDDYWIGWYDVDSWNFTVAPGGSPGPWAFKGFIGDRTINTTTGSYTECDIKNLSAIAPQTSALMVATGLGCTYSKLNDGWPVIGTVIQQGTGDRPMWYWYDRHTGTAKVQRYAVCYGNKGPLPPAPTPTPTATPVVSANCSVPVYSKPAVSFDGFNVVDQKCYTIIPEITQKLPWVENEVYIPGFTLCVTWYSFPRIGVLGITIPFSIFGILPAAFLMRKIWLL